MLLVSFALVSLLSGTVFGQLTSSVGPLTSRSAKAATKTCNVLNYGAKADKSTDLGPPLLSAFNACKSGGVVVVPSGDYALETWQTLSGGNAWALQLDGMIYRTGTSGGNMLFIEHSTDFELFSSTSKGGIQGLGYVLHAQGSITGARILRLYEVTSFSVHDIVLVDAPAFHFVMDTCTKGEVYNMAIRGGDHGGLDGIDVWGDNIWVHDVEVTNKDECVTVKSPASNMLIENIYCNWSGGCAIGSLGTGTSISNIEYKNVYTWSSNQMMMIKSNGGDGTVKSVTFDGFIGHGNAYSFNIDQYWSSQSTQSGNGVQLSDITVSNWHGTEASGSARGPIRVICADGAPCTSVSISNFAMWTESGSSQWYACRSAYGTGACLHSGSAHNSYAASTITVRSAPSGYSAPTMAADLKTAFGFTTSIPIPAVPTSFYPGATPVSKLLGS
ncbi:glycoside hydrolase family 28 protein [Neolentinus lepideus HHB14362 ss-1]|uniref:Glycoside hydrolase family 28 protein n=1 Tax=Neolentinus lepideus HHB14362 ss-1 TaxID=1314782 RepID=A0A165VFF8_9AGAM|nr:glycoside hydrolase family 28 protein [Neolentinus lepideus HHB14362 ss-1]